MAGKKCDRCAWDNGDVRLRFGLCLWVLIWVLRTLNNTNDLVWIKQVYSYSANYISHATHERL